VQEIVAADSRLRDFNRQALSVGIDSRSTNAALSLDAGKQDARDAALGK
jgi:hypothetical protein